MTKATQQAADYIFEKTNETPRTVRVRIAVAVNDEGQYSAEGWWPRTYSDAELLLRVTAGLEGVMSCVWIEADVPLPTQTIRGEIVS